MNAGHPIERAVIARRGRQLEYFTVAWNAVEAIVGFIAGWHASSVALFGFGLDSMIEVTSGFAALWRMASDSDPEARQQSEHYAQRVIGICFAGLAVFILYESVRDLIYRQVPEHSAAGIVLACAAMIVMPLLSRAKKNVGRQLSSGAMKADAKQSEFCGYLSAILLVGLVLNAQWGLWWADPAAALVMVPIIGNEGIRLIRKQNCSNQ